MVEVTHELFYFDIEIDILPFVLNRALNEDSEKLIQEGEPNDPQLKRLQREIDEVGI